MLNICQPERNSSATYVHLAINAAQSRVGLFGRSQSLANYHLAPHRHRMTIVESSSFTRSLHCRDCQGIERFAIKVAGQRFAIDSKQLSLIFATNNYVFNVIGSEKERFSSKRSSRADATEVLETDIDATIRRESFIRHLDRFSSAIAGFALFYRSLHCASSSSRFPDNANILNSVRFSLSLRASGRHAEML